MDLLGILPGALRTVGKLLGIGPKVEEIATAIAGATPEQRLQLQESLQEHEARVLGLAVEQVKAETASDDKFVSRQRATGCYIAYAILVVNYCLFPVFKVSFAMPLEILLALLGFPAWYGWLRTKEKMNGGNGH
jgi:hypothetical protein